jgi:hypothetical protein
MKIKIAQLVLLLLVGAATVMGQTSDRKAQKEKKRIEKEKEIAALVESKTFVFKANRAIPTGYKSVDLTTNPNFVKFSPDLIVSEMPFFGRAYSVAYGGSDSGLKFEGKPEVFKVEKKKKNYEIEARIKGTGDSYTINLTVSFEGSSTMSVTSNNRNPISYYGEIFAPETSMNKNSPKSMNKFVDVPSGQCFSLILI